MATISTTRIEASSIPPSLIPLFLQKKLNPLLPYPLPLYRRCQFFLNKTQFGSSGLSSSSTPSNDSEPGQEEVWVAVAGSTLGSESKSGVGDWLTTWLNIPEARIQQQPSSGGISASLTTNTQANTNASNASKHSAPWLAALIDIKEPGQTQVWVFGSWEVLFPSPSISSSQTTSPPVPSQAQIALGRALIHRLRTHHIPSLPTTPTPQYCRLVDEGKVITQPYLRSRVLFGTVAEASWWLLCDAVVKDSSISPNTDDKHVNDNTVVGDVDSSTAITRVDRPYLKYLFHLPLPPPQPSTATLTGEGKAHNSLETITAPLATTHLQTMLDRSPIPRTLETLKSLTTVGIFLSSPPTQGQEQHAGHDPRSSGDPIAWGMVGKDASISSLHTEDGYRGCGLAGTVVRELIEAQRSVFRTTKLAINMESEDEDKNDVPWAHSDVSVSNVASRRVFEKMGAKVWWRVGWIEVDLGEMP